MLPTTTVLVKTLRVVAPAGSDTLATVIGVVGVVLALAALAWQAWSFRQSGSRVRVTLQSGMRDQAGSVITGLAHTTTAQEPGVEGVRVAPAGHTALRSCPLNTRALARGVIVLTVAIGARAGAGS